MGGRRGRIIWLRMEVRFRWDSRSGDTLHTKGGVFKVVDVWRINSTVVHISYASLHVDAFTALYPKSLIVTSPNHI